jgi:hypothetical protein
VKSLPGTGELRNACDIRIGLRTEGRNIVKLVEMRDVGAPRSPKYMVRRVGTPSPTWRSFLSNEAIGIAAIDVFVAVSVSFRPLYIMIILALSLAEHICEKLRVHPAIEEEIFYPAVNAVHDKVAKCDVEEVSREHKQIKSAILNITKIKGAEPAHGANESPQRRCRTPRG